MLAVRSSLIALTLLFTAAPAVAADVTPPPEDEGCSCSVPGHGRSSMPAVAVGLVVAGIALARGRRR